VSNSVQHVTTQITRYDVSCLPEGHVDRYVFTVTVEYRGKGRWAVCWLRDCADRNGVLDFEPIPSGREDEWLDSHRFDLDTALDIAVHVATQLKVNGWTVPAVLARDATGDEQP
jgi:hypothetical protein